MDYERFYYVRKMEGEDDGSCKLSVIKLYNVHTPKRLFKTGSLQRDVKLGLRGFSNARITLPTYLSSSGPVVHKTPRLFP